MTKEERLNAEIERTRLMGEFEKEYIMYANVCGIDEAEGVHCAALLLPVQSFCPKNVIYYI